MKASGRMGAFSPLGLLRKLPILAVIAAVFTVGYLIFQQLGYDSTTVEVEDVETGEPKDFRIVSVLPRDAIPAITNPKFVPATEAELWMDRGEQVIALEIGSDIKAYPINILSRHEIVNDVVGGVALAITW